MSAFLRSLFVAAFVAVISAPASALVYVKPLILYTPDASLRADVAPRQQHANFIVDLMNQALIDSGVSSFRFLLPTVGSARTIYDQYEACSVVPIAASDLGIAQQRQDAAADFVVVINDQSSGPLGCALQINATASTAFVHSRADASLLERTVAHEVGHLLGARHPLFNDSNPDPKPSAPANAHGHIVPFSSPQIPCAGDIMHNKAVGSCAGFSTDSRNQYAASNRNFIGYNVASGSVQENAAVALQVNGPAASSWHLIPAVVETYKRRMRPTVINAILLFN